MTDPKTPTALDAAAVPPRAQATSYPAELVKRVAGREKRVLGDRFGLRAFGVNLTRLAPGAQSAFRHRHTRQEEFLYVLEGEPTLVTDAGEVALRPGMCAGFPAGGTAHQLVNRTERDVVYLEVGDRAQGDEAIYPDDDLKAARAPDGSWRYTHKDGSAY
ncbi:MAG TPA: cupin domain-containing protein [Anaeromyxobacteraceae bacterium]